MYALAVGSIFDDMPFDVLERLAWLRDLENQFNHRLFAEYRAAYFAARLQGLLDPALDLDLHSRKQVMAWTRSENEIRGRTIRWGDGRG